MNKTELLAAVASKFAAVDTEEKHNTLQSITYYTVNVFDVVGETCRSAKVPFFVKDDNLSGEEAYWGGGEPKPSPGSPTFAQETQAWINSKIGITVGDKTIMMSEQFSVNNVQERATAVLTLKDAGTGNLSAAKVMVWRVAGVFQYQVVAA